MRHRILKAISFFVIFFFVWTSGGLVSVVYAAYNEIQNPSVNQKQEQRLEEKFQQAIEDIKNIILEKPVDGDKKSITSKISAVFETKKSRLKTKRDEIESFDNAIRSQFAATEKKLKNAGLPAEILQRHYNFVKHYEDNLKELKTNLDAADKAKTKAEFDSQIQKVQQHLDKVAPPKKHKVLDPNKLPHRISDIKRKEPRTKPQEFQKDLKQTANVTIPAVIPVQTGIQEAIINNKPILLASNGSLEGLLESLPKVEKQLLPPPIILAQAPNPPTDADLAETIEVQLTPAIKAKAQELNYSPVKIYNWVRNNIEYVPTYGSIQGADMCLQTKQGNDFDIASLLIALLRASNIHARYVYGTIELPIDKVMNWVGGFTDANAALDFISSGGTPVAGIISGGKIASARMEHVWVEAYINYYPLRGAAHKTGQGDTWIPLDASYKQYTYTQGADIKSAVPFDAQAFINQVQSTATIDTANSSVTNINSTYIQQQMQSYQTQVKNYIDQNYPNATVGDVLGKKDIIKQEFTYLLGTLPYRGAIIGVKYSEIPDNLRHKITFSILDEIGMETSLSLTKSLPELAFAKITLSYAPATTADQLTIKSYADNEAASYPAYLINLIPELKINGSVLSSGAEITMGKTQSFVMTFAGPNQQQDAISNVITAGDLNVIGLNLSVIPYKAISDGKARLEAVKSKLETNSSANITKEEVLEEILNLTAIDYFTHLDVSNYLNQRDMGVVSARLPSEAIVTFAMSINYFFGIPLSASFGGISIDVDRDISVTKSKDGNPLKAKQFMVAKGMNGSAMEHSIMEELYSTQTDATYGVSAVKIISIANNTGIPIYTIDQSNINQIMPLLQLSQEVKTDIQNSINAGKVVTVPKTDVNYHGWTGVGYIVMNPETGAAGYIISDGTAGGWAILGMLLFGLFGTKGLALIMIGSVLGAPWIAFLGAFLIGVAIGLLLSQILSAGDKADLSSIAQYVIKNWLLGFLAVIGSPLWWLALVAFIFLFVLPYLITFNMPKRQRYYANSDEYNWKMVMAC